MVCAECMKMCCLGGKNSVVKGLRRIGINVDGEEPSHFPFLHDEDALALVLVQTLLP